MSQPRILIINDDRALIETRRMLLEDCGAIVFTARGSEEALREASHDPADLVLIDATNVGLEQGEKLCGIVKSLRPSECIAMLVTPELDIPSDILDVNAGKFRIKLCADRYAATLRARLRS